MGTAGDYQRPAPALARATGVTNGAGQVTFAWPAGMFAAPPVVTLAVQAGAGFRSSRITANAAGSTTVEVLQAAGVTVLGIGVLAVGAAAAGVTVHATATAAP